VIAGSGGYRGVYGDVHAGKASDGVVVGHRPQHAGRVGGPVARELCAASAYAPGPRLGVVCGYAAQCRVVAESHGDGGAVGQRER
jgi:hypothetical protein